MSEEYGVQQDVSIYKVPSGHGALDNKLGVPSLIESREEIIDVVRVKVATLALHLGFSLNLIDP